MFALLGASTVIAPTRVRAHRAPAGPSRRVRVPVRARASSGSKNADERPSRREVLAAPGLAALTAQLWFPGSASANSPAAAKQAAGPPGIPGIKPVSVGYDDWTTDLSAFGPPSGPLGGSVGCTDYAQFKPVIQGFIDGIKSGECPPWAKDASRGFLLREEGGNRVMLTVLIPAGKAQKDGLAFFIDKGPKANPLWEEANKTWRDPAVPIEATASTGFLIRGAPPESMKGKWFGQYRLGWNGKVQDWVPQFTSPEATDFHNSVGIPFSVAHEIVRAPGNTYATKAKTGIEVFHLFNSKRGGEELAKVFTPDSPFFADERYIGPYEQTLWKIEDDIIFNA